MSINQTMKSNWVKNIFAVFKGGLVQAALFAAVAMALVGGAKALSAHELAVKTAAAVDAHYNSLHSLRTNFTESYDGLGMRRTERGTLLLAKPGRMKWVYSEPKGKLFVLDGKWAWFWSDGSSEVQRMSANKLDDLRSPLRFLLGHTRLEKELSGLSAQNTGDGLVELTGTPGETSPRQPNAISAIRLRVTADGSIRQLEIEQVDGSLTRFDFDHEEPNVPLNDTEFKFTPPAGVPVVDAMPPI